MQRQKRVWAAVSISATPVGLTLARLHLIGPSPGTYFGLGVLATLSVLGIIWGFNEARKVVLSGQAIGNL